MSIEVYTGRMVVYTRVYLGGERWYIPGCTSPIIPRGCIYRVYLSIIPRVYIQVYLSHPRV